MSSEKYFLSKTVYRAQQKPDPKASKLPEMFPNVRFPKSNKFSSKITKKRPASDIDIARAYDFLIRSLIRKKATIGIRIMFAFSKKEAVEPSVAGFLTAMNKSTGIPAAATEIKIY
ncbi:unnamed protein product, partial [marine sediment metagenome]